VDVAVILKAQYFLEDSQHGGFVLLPCRNHHF
jgi:hypothetical protein